MENTSSMDNSTRTNEATDVITQTTSIYYLLYSSTMAFKTHIHPPLPPEVIFPMQHVILARMDSSPSEIPIPYTTFPGIY
jgi:hypothetical protein